MLQLSNVEDLNQFKGGGIDLGVSSVAKTTHPLVREAVESACHRHVSRQLLYRLVEQVMPEALSLS
jgi:hypothetical protein